jgi:hypothetical protein
VANTQAPRQWLRSKPVLQVSDLPLGPAPINPPVLYRGDTGGVIAAVLKPLQGFDQPRDHIGRSGDRDNSTHWLSPCPGRFCGVLAARARPGNRL